MPVYPGSGKATLLYENRSAYLFQNESRSNGDASVAVQLHRVGSAPFGFSLDIQFDADPGVYEIDVENSDTDADANFFAVQQVSSTPNSSFAVHVEFPLTRTTFTRVRQVSTTNAVKTTVKVSR